MTRQPLLAYYVGAYGSTIRIDSQSLEELVAAGQLFRRLASGAVREADLGEALVAAWTRSARSSSDR